MEQSITSRIREYKLRSHLRESSEEILDRAVRWFVELLGDVNPDVVTFGHVEDYKSWLAKGRSESSANTYLRIFKPFFSWMAKRRHIELDPFDGLRLYTVAEKKFEQYNPDEIHRIFKVANLRWQAIVCLALCSMRRAEILNLNIKDIDFEKDLILIKPKKDTEYTWRWDIKDHNEAYIGISDEVSRFLIMLAEQIQDGMPYVILKPKYFKRNMKLKKQKLLTTRLRNCPWGNFNRDFGTLLKRACVKKKRFHDLRGTFATDRYNEGYSLKELQYLLRHSSINTTANYIRNIEEQKLVAKSGQTFKKYYVSNVP